ncbi:Uncharacterized protein HZ326_30698 [Fusarium oxysporum f. sp. albedinis]|nr:Uncharacterized protein HZ326_30698 [Fusarium oxysporum f. sp. albedinis]
MNMQLHHVFFFFFFLSFSYVSNRNLLAFYTKPDSKGAVVTGSILMRRSPVCRHFVLSIAQNGSSYDALGPEPSNCASTSSINATKPTLYIYLAHSPSGSLRIETTDRRNLQLKNSHAQSGSFSKNDKVSWIANSSIRMMNQKHHT